MQLVKFYKNRQKILRQRIQKLVEKQIRDYMYYDASRQGYTTYCDSDLTGDIFIDIIRSDSGMTVNIYPVEQKHGYRNVTTTPENSLYTCDVPLDYYSITPEEMSEMLSDILYNYIKSPKIRAENTLSRSTFTKECLICLEQKKFQ